MWKYDFKNDQKFPTKSHNFLMFSLEYFAMKSQEMAIPDF